MWKRCRRMIGLGSALVMVMSTTLAAPPHTGIQGQAFLYVVLGIPIEIEPGFWIGIPNVQTPTATSFSIVAAPSGRQLGRFLTDTNGQYAVSLPPGKYVLWPEPLVTRPFISCPPTLARPIEVTVKAKEFTVANIFYVRHGVCAIVGEPQ